MQRIYSNRAAALVHNIKNTLNSHGIETVVKGESLTGAGVGELPAWVELWLIDETRLEEAKQMVEEEIRHAKSTSSPDEEVEPWICPNCGEEVDPEFASCWNCGAEPEE